MNNPSPNPVSNTLTILVAILAIIVSVFSIIGGVFYLLKYIDDIYFRKDYADIKDMIKRIEDNYSSELAKKTKEFDDKINGILQSTNSKAEEVKINFTQIKNKLDEYESNAKLALTSIWNIEREAKNVVSTTISTGLSVNDDTDKGIIKGKFLNFSKNTKPTALRLVYTDNFRVAGIDKGCRWEILIDGSSCPSGALIFDRHDSNGSNNHDSTSLVSYCEGISEGEHNISVVVGPVPGQQYTTDSNCFTGWNESRWLLEVQEMIIKK